MALYIPHSIFHLARFLYVWPETFGPYYAHDSHTKKYVDYKPIKYELRLYGFRSEILHGVVTIIPKLLFLPLQPAETGMVVTVIFVTSNVICVSLACDVDIMAVHDPPRTISVQEQTKT